MSLDIQKPGLNLVNAYNVITAITNENQIGYGAAQSAAGTTQATATAINNTQSLYEITTAAASTGVMLPLSAAGDRLEICNNGAQTITVYTNVNEVGSNKINTTAGATGVTQAAGNNAIYCCMTRGQWYRISGT